MSTKREYRYTFNAAVNVLTAQDAFMQACNESWSYAMRSVIAAGKGAMIEGFRIGMHGTMCDLTWVVVIPDPISSQPPLYVAAKDLCVGDEVRGSIPDDDRTILSVTHIYDQVDSGVQVEYTDGLHRFFAFHDPVVVYRRPTSTP